MKKLQKINFTFCLNFLLFFFSSRKYHLHRIRYCRPCRTVHRRLQELLAIITFCTTHECINSHIYTKNNLLFDSATFRKYMYVHGENHLLKFYVCFKPHTYIPKHTARTKALIGNTEKWKIDFYCAFHAHTFASFHICLYGEEGHL